MLGFWGIQFEMSDVMVQFRHKGLVRNKKYLGSIFIFESIKRNNSSEPPHKWEVAASKL
jgi:hypothetical protein